MRPDNAAMRRVYCVVGARCSGPSPDRPTPRTRWLRWLGPMCCGIALAGCSSYGSNMKVGQKAETGRRMADILRDRSSNLNDLTAVISNIKDAQTAQAAVEQVKKLYGDWSSLVLEEKKADLTVRPEDENDLKGQKGRIESAEGNLNAQIEGDLRQKFQAGLPPNLDQAFKDGQAAVDAAKNTDVAAAISSEIVATPPQAGTWMMWILSLFVLAACAAFLFKDGIWSNAIRLVNVVFAGLLTMNYHEMLAKFATNYSEDLRAFTPFMDFLSFWVCFVGFAAIFTAITDKVSRVRVRFLQVAERAGGIALSLAIGWVMVGIVLTSLHTAPLDEYPFLGCFQPQSSMFLGVLAPDREWLGFTKYQSEGPLCRSLPNLKVVAFSDAGENNFIDKHWKRRIELAKYVDGNMGHNIKVNKQFVKTASP